MVWPLALGLFLLIVAFSPRSAAEEATQSPAMQDRIAEPVGPAEKPTISDPFHVPPVEEIARFQTHPVKVYQVNEELSILVISGEELGWAQPGSPFVLVAQNDQPLATVQLTELDPAGFAVVHITHRVDPNRSIRKGELLFARQLLKPIPPR